MKNYLCTIIIFSLLFSCSEKSDQKETSTQDESAENPAISDSLEEVKVNSFYYVRELVDTLPTVKFPQVWNNEKLSNMDTEGGVLVNLESFNQWRWFIDRFEYSGNNPVLFYWKYKADNYTLVCFSTFEMYAKGGTTEYYIATLALEKEEEAEEDGPKYYLIDISNIAASRSISTENPNGGTSSGLEYQYASLNKGSDKMIFFSTTLNEESLIYNISQNGKITKDFIKSYWDDYMLPRYVEADLVSITNQVDHINYEFKNSDDTFSFDHQLNNKIYYAPLYKEVKADNGSPISIFELLPGVQKKYVLRYEKIYTPEISGDPDDYYTTLLLTGIGDYGHTGEWSDSTFLEVPHRMMHGVIKDRVLVNSEGVKKVYILVEEKNSTREYLFITRNKSEFSENFYKYYKVGDDILLQWEWVTYNISSEGEDGLPIRTIVRLH